MLPSMNVYLATVWLFASKGVFGGELPRVWWQPGTAVQEGDTIQLQCQVAADVDEPAIWLKLDPTDPNSHILLSHGEMVIIEDPRFSASHVPERNTYIVEISSVSEDDAGSYQCQVPIITEEEELRVEAAPPVVVTLLTDPSLKASGNSSYLFSSFRIFLLIFCLLVTLAR
ncbi:lachesin-like [Palaemon carinicauda]|uniref:lachesin-like n=1 Tax=Palaemon carinicauda TaxID=392227 RepID=UPI0035B591B2